MKTGYINKNVIVSVFLVILLLSFVSSVYAITGSIGNARMILRPEVGDTIDRTILVKNVNDVPLDIELSASGDLENDINIKDSEFRLEAGDERKAAFTINVKNPGTTETKINVKFSPTDGGNGVGLSSTIIVIPEGSSDAEDDGEGFFGGLFGGEDDELVEGNQENGEVSVGQDKQDDVSGEAGKEEGKGIGLMAIGGTFTIIMFLVLLILLALASKHMKKKKSNKSSEKSEKTDAE